MIGKAVVGLLLLVVVYAIARANGIVSEDFVTHHHAFLEWGADLVVQGWEFLLSFLP